MGRVDKLTVTHIDTYMGQAFLICVLEEYHITGLQLGLGNCFTLLVHGIEGAADLDAQTVQYIIDKAGAVKTGAGGGAAPEIGDSQMLLGLCHNLIAGNAAGLNIAGGGAPGTASGVIA